MNEKLELIIYKLLDKQLDGHFDEKLGFYNKDNLKKWIPIALKQMDENYQMAASKRMYNGEMIFNPLFSVTWMIFLYRMSRIAYLGGDINTADCLYYLNKIMHSNDWFYQVELPIHFLGEHPLGSVLGKAQYGDYLFVYQGTTIGGNRRGGVLSYPVIGNNVVLYANSTILGNTKIGNNVIISANSYIINEIIPDNSIVFGSSPNLVIKRKSSDDILKMTSHIWKW